MKKKNLVIGAMLALLVGGCASNPDYSDGSGNQEINLEAGKYDESPANLFIQLAYAYLREGDVNTALINAEKAVEKDPSNPNAHNILALLYQRLGQPTKAEQEYREALSIAPNDPYINNAYGGFQCELKNLDKAMIHFKKTINHPLYRDKWIPMTNIGICALRMDNLELAQEYFRKALQINGKFRIALYNMIEVSVLQEKYMSARAYLQRYLEVGEHDSKTLWWGIQTEKVLGDRDRLDSYRLLLRVKFPDSEEAHLLMADK